MQTFWDYGTESRICSGGLVRFLRRPNKKREKKSVNTSKTRWKILGALVAPLVIASCALTYPHLHYGVDLQDTIQNSRMLHPEGEENPRLDLPLEACRRDERGFKCVIQFAEDYEREMEENLNLARRVKELEKKLSRCRRTRGRDC